MCAMQHMHPKNMPGSALMITVMPNSRSGDHHLLQLRGADTQAGSSLIETPLKAFWKLRVLEISKNSWLQVITHEH